MVISSEPEVVIGTPHGRRMEELLDVWRTCCYVPGKKRNWAFLSLVFSPHNHSHMSIPWISVTPAKMPFLRFRDPPQYVRRELSPFHSATV